MRLLLYDIEAKKDPHGIRIRLVRALRKAGAYQLHRSAWVFDEMDDATAKVIREYRGAGGSVKITEWIPRTLSEVSQAKGSPLKVTVAVNGGDPIVEGAHSSLKKALASMGFIVELRPLGENALVALSKEEGRRASLLQMNRSISRMLDEVALRDIDVLILLNSGRSVQSGIIFGAQTISNTKILKNMVSFPLIQIEGFGRREATLIQWSDSAKGFARRVADELGMPIITPNIETKAITVQGRKEMRQVHYANMGDRLIINGREVGTCLAEQIFIVVEDGKLVEIIGGKMNKREAGRMHIESISSSIIKTVPSNKKN